MSLSTSNRSLFSCSSCTTNLYRALSSLHLSPTDALGLITPQQIQAAQHSTVASIRKGHHRRALSKSIKHVAAGKELSWSKSRYRDGPVKWERRSIRARALNQGHLDVEKPESAKYDLFKEIQYTRDPFQLNNIVRRGLRDGQRAQALEVTRTVFSEGVRNVVSWNSIINFDMESGRPQDAMDVYKEMKERGCRPDSHTYFLVLRGLARNANKSTPNFNVVKQATKVYEHLKAPRSGVEVLWQHTNSLIEVCAKAHDMDALWSHAAHFAEEGSDAPNIATYVIILKALIENDAAAGKSHTKAKMPTDTERKDEETRSSEQLSASTVRDAEALWNDIKLRWLSGDLQIDERFVSFMGGIYLQSEERSDWEKVFTLVEETTNIKGNQLSGSNTSNGIPIKDLTDASLSAKFQYVKPSNEILTVVINACSKLRLKKAATGYWTLFTSSNGIYKIKPNYNNYKDYLRCLRVARASAEAAELISNVYADEATKEFLRRPSLFSLALAACKRDIWNPSVFSNATQIMDVMSKVFRPGQHHGIPPALLKSYLEIGIGPQPGAHNPSPTSHSKRPDLLASAKNLSETLRRIIPYVENGATSSFNDRNEIAREAVSACDRIIFHSDSTSAFSGSSLKEEILKLKQRFSSIVTDANIPNTASEPTTVDSDEPNASPRRFWAQGLAPIPGFGGQNIDPKVKA